MFARFLAFIISLFSLAAPKPPVIPVTPAPTNFAYPISNYQNRLTLRHFGQLLTAKDQGTVSCGAAFTGYHTGDDLETTAAEANLTIPVYSILNGKILEVSHVQGYGGLIVASYTINNQPVTAYYGHISLESALVKPGDLVSLGEKIADLGSACSNQTDGERKHLHFAIHQGKTIDVRGYVPTSGELSSWLPPAATLSLLQKG